MKRNNPDSEPEENPKKKPKYYTYETDNIRCNSCNWSGLGKEAIVGDLIDYGFYLDCPKCHHEFIAYIEYPTNDEVKEFGTTKEKRDIVKYEKFWENFESKKLKSPDQIEDIKGDTIILYWDHINGNQEITHNPPENKERKVIWTEPALYESYERFIAVGNILKQKFGSRFKDFIPTKRSELYLYGDRWSSIEKVEQFRKSLSDK